MFLLKTGLDIFNRIATVFIALCTFYGLLNTAKTSLSFRRGSLRLNLF
jgi:hypothetical protein